MTIAIVHVHNNNLKLKWKAKRNPCVNMKITEARVICNNVDILDWYVY